MRILVTGSRDWSDGATGCAELAEQARIYTRRRYG